jgi:probable phosphoglycerate mutase
MSESLPIVYLARHGETAWSLSDQHTRLTEYFLESGALVLLLLGWHKIRGDTHG